MEKKTELMTVDNIRNRVYVIRGQQVMLDYDLAEIYGYEVKRLNEQVKNNISRFPEDLDFKNFVIYKGQKFEADAAYTQNGHGRNGFLTTAVVNDFANQYPPLRIKSNPDCAMIHPVIDGLLSGADIAV
ncbi:MAG: ORF6N domain-containing protein [Lachnospiraceae bacterium]|nr:ORF6N domain-containing protein [Lachnospiraceae bacterium]